MPTASAPTDPLSTEVVTATSSPTVLTGPGSSLPPTSTVEVTVTGLNFGPLDPAVVVISTSFNTEAPQTSTTIGSHSKAPQASTTVGPHSSNISTGVKAGIGAGVSLGVVAVLVVSAVLSILRWKNRKRIAAPTTSGESEWEKAELPSKNVEDYTLPKASQSTPAVGTWTKPELHADSIAVAEANDSKLEPFGISYIDLLEAMFGTSSVNAWIHQICVCTLKHPFATTGVMHLILRYQGHVQVEQYLQLDIKISFK